MDNLIPILYNDRLSELHCIRTQFLSTDSCQTFIYCTFNIILTNTLHNALLKVQKNLSLENASKYCTGLIPANSL